MRLFAARDRVRSESVEPYLYRIAINLASNRRRRDRLWRRVKLTEFEGDGGPETYEARERERAVRRAMDRLPEKLKRVVVLTELTELTELSYREVADVLNIPVGTVGSRRNAALDKLEADLKQLDEAAR